MLPVASRRLPDDSDRWAFEVKHDGFRALLFCTSEGVRIQSRNLRWMTGFYPELQALRAVLGDRHAVLDGELVAYDEAGQPSFEALQRRAGMHEDDGFLVRLRRRARPSTPIAYQIFDLLFLDGRSLLRTSYSERRQRLLGLGLQGPHWITPSHHEGPGADALLAATRAASLEGLVAKRLDSPYLPGERSDHWLKIKNWCRQEFVLAGWREEPATLLVGYYEGEELRYAGGVELGLTSEAVEVIRDLLPGLARADCPFTGRTSRRSCSYLEPLLVVEIQFLGWTSKGSLKHAAFKGFVLDRAPRAVRREAT